MLIAAFLTNFKLFHDIVLVELNSMLTN